MRVRALLLTMVFALLAAGCASDGAQAPATDAASAPATEESPDSGEPYFAGKDIEIIVPIGPGGNTDRVARLLGEFLEQHVEGNPTVQVMNIEGGGNMLGTNTWALQRETDGTHLILLPVNAIAAAFLGNEAVEYDFADMHALAGSPNPRIGYFTAPTGIEEPHEMAGPTDEPLYFGAVSATSADTPNIIAFEALGIFDKIEFIFGYEGGSEITAAVESGELNMSVTGASSFARRDMPKVESGDFTGVYSFGLPDGEGGLLRDPLMPDFPHVGEVYEQIHGQEPSGEAWDAFMYMQDYLVTGGQSMFVHADAPPEAIEALEAGLAKMAEDETFLESIDENFPHGILLGDRVRAWGETLATPDDEKIQWIRDFLTEHFEVEF